MWLLKCKFVFLIDWHSLNLIPFRLFQISHINCLSFFLSSMIPSALTFYSEFHPYPSTYRAINTNDFLVPTPLSFPKAFCCSVIPWHSYWLWKFECLLLKQGKIFCFNSILCLSCVLSHFQSSCNPMECVAPQALLSMGSCKNLGRLPCPLLKGPFRPGDRLPIPALQGDFFTHWAT